MVGVYTYVLRPAAVQLAGGGNMMEIRSDHYTRVMVDVNDAVRDGLRAIVRRWDTEAEAEAHAEGSAGQCRRCGRSGWLYSDPLALGLRVPAEGDWDAAGRLVLGVGETGDVLCDRCHEARAGADR